MGELSLMSMSDEFITVATQELNTGIDRILGILQNCRNDDDVARNAVELKKPFHNIKGLAPMMGKQEIGSLAAVFDLLLRKLHDGASVPGILDSILPGVNAMKKAMTASIDLKSITDEISKKYAHILS